MAMILTLQAILDKKRTVAYGTKVVPDNILPDSRLRNNGTPQGSKVINGMNFVPIFCANCGAPGGFVPEENMTFAFYLCDVRQNGCYEKHGVAAHFLAIPDRVFWQKVKEAQIERYGRELTSKEVIQYLADPNSLMSVLAKSRKAITPKGST
jgi:hypothetical protein